MDSTIKRPTELEAYLKKKQFFNCRGDRCGTSMIPTSFINQWEIREDCRKKYSFAILTRAMIERIRPYGPVLEVGAGLGYWSYELNNAGISCITTDICPGEENPYFELARRWVNILGISANEAIETYTDIKTLLMCWPSYSELWAYEALAKFKGNTLIYIGEEATGCCASDEFFEHIEKYWKEKEDLNMPQFFGLHDVALVYKREEVALNTRYDIIKKG